MKHIDEIYKEWCGESHMVNSGHPVHDSADCTDFAEYYGKYYLTAKHDAEKEELKERIKKLEFMIDKGLGWEDIDSDLLSQFRKGGEK